MKPCGRGDWPPGSASRRRARWHKSSGSRAGLAQDCYGQLVAEGYLIARPRIRARASRRARSHAMPLAPSLPPYIPTWADRPTSGPGVPDLASFPVRDWLWAHAEAGGRVAPHTAFGLRRASSVRPELRTVLATYLRRVRGTATVPGLDRGCAAGFTQGALIWSWPLLASARATPRLGASRTRVISRLGQPIARRGPACGPAAGPGRPSTAQDVPGFAAGRRAARSLLTPAHQAPTAWVLRPGAAARSRSAWAARNATVSCSRTTTTAEFRYDRQAVGSLQGLAPDRVAHRSARRARPSHRPSDWAGSSVHRTCNEAVVR